MGFIKDKKGQWAHPGKNTLIPDADGRITMKGVNYPVLGIDDEGNQQMMMPGGEYQFPGNDVYEIPLPKFQKKGELLNTTRLVDGYQDLFKVNLPSSFYNATTTPFNVSNRNFNFKDFENYRTQDFDQWLNYIKQQQLGSGSKYELGIFNQGSILQPNKKGKINVNNAYNSINSIQTPLTKQIMLQTLDEFSYTGTYPDGTPVPRTKEIDFDLFKENVNAKLATYEHELSPDHAKTGLGRLGYVQVNEMSGTAAPTQAEYDFQKAEEAKILNNYSVLFKSEALGPNTATGIGSVTGAYHFKTPKLYGHMRFFNHVDNPQLMYILELQSDEMQQYHRIGKSIKELQQDNINFNRLLNGEEEIVAGEMFDKLWMGASSPQGPLGKVGAEGGITANSQFPIITNLTDKNYSKIPQDENNLLYFRQDFSYGPKTWEETRFPINKDITTLTFNSYDEVLKFRQQFIDEKIAGWHSGPAEYSGVRTLKDDWVLSTNTGDVRTDWENSIKNNERRIHDLTVASTTDPSLLSKDELIRNLQKKKLQKNQMQRLFDETIKYALTNGYNEIAFPAAETVATIQNYKGNNEDLHNVIQNPWTQEKEEDFYKHMWRLTSGRNYDVLLANRDASMIRNYGDFYFVPQGYKGGADSKNENIITNRYELGYRGGYSLESSLSDFQTRVISTEVPGNLKPGSLYIKQEDGTWNIIEHPTSQFVSVGGGGVAAQNPNWTGQEWENSFRGITMNINEATKAANDPLVTQEYITDPVTGNLIPKVQPPRFQDVEQNVYNIIKPYRDKKHIVLDNGGFNISNFNKNHQTILSKYTEKEFKSYLENIFGKDYPYRVGTDPKGNKFFYFTPPDAWFKGETPMQIKAKGGEVLPKYQKKGEVENPVDPASVVNFDDLEKGIRHVESLDGVLMKNPQSSASGYYQDLFDNIDYDGTRDEFIADTDFQLEYFKKRYNGEIKDVPGLRANGEELYEKYKDQIDDFNLTATEIAAISNMLGRQGTRYYLGYVLRDGDTLEETFPHLYGDKRQLGKDGKPLENKTPEEYIKEFNEALDKKQIGGEIKNEVIADMLEAGAFLPKFKMGAEMNLEGRIGKYIIKKNYDEKHRLPYIQFNSNDGKIRDNRVYYDKDDDTGTDNFNIIDLESQIMHQDREHERVKKIIIKYDNGEKLSPIEEKHLIDIGILEKPAPMLTPIPKEIINANLNTNISKKIEDINITKDLYNKTDGNKKGLTLMKQIEIYDAHINDIYRGNDKSIKVKKIYDKLNSLYYNDAKSSSMTVFDYIKSLNN